MEDGMRWMEKAFDEGYGNVEAGVYLVAMKVKMGVDVDAIRVLTIAAERGNANAMLLLGLKLREEGEGEGAANWFMKAAEAGNVEAIGHLRDEELKERMFESAVGRGSIRAMRLYGELMMGMGKENEDKMVKYFGMATERGCGVSANHLGCYYGKKMDFANAEIWFERGMRLGNKVATYNFGVILWRDMGLVDDSRIREAWSIAAKHGVMDAHTCLAMWLGKNRFIDEAVECLRRGASAGCVESMERLEKYGEEIGDNMMVERYRVMRLQGGVGGLP